jgi:hypothetical protein
LPPSLRQSAHNAAGADIAATEFVIVPGPDGNREYVHTKLESAQRMFFGLAFASVAE